MPASVFVYMDVYTPTTKSTYHQAHRTQKTQIVS